MSKATSKTDLLKTHGTSLVKQYLTYDGQSRVSKVYTAYTDAADGSPCEVTEYIYTTSNGTSIKARKEGNDVWNGAWDADFTVSS